MQGNIEKQTKNLALRRMITMYRKPSAQLKIEDFVLPFEGKLNPENRTIEIIIVGYLFNAFQALIV